MKAQHHLPINFQIFTEKHLNKDLLPKTVQPANPKVEVEPVASPAKQRAYKEPTITRSAPKDRIEIW